MASVAADPGAIAPPLPLPSRPDAPTPAGASNTFADLLDGTNPPTASQPQSAATSPGQSGAPAGSGSGSAEPATGAATAGPRTGKDDGGKDTNEQLSAIDVTLVAGLALPPLSLAAPPNPDQTPAASQDLQEASTDPAPAAGGNASDKPSDRKDASAPSDPVPAGLVAALSNLIPMTAAPAVARSAPDSTAPVRFSPVAALRSAAIFAGPSTSAPPGIDASSSASAQQRDGVADLSPATAATTQNVVPAVPSVSSAPDVDASQTAAAPALQATTDPAASDQTGTSTIAAAPIITPAAPPTPSTAMNVLAPINPAPPARLPAEIRVTDQPAGDAGSPRAAEDLPVPLPAQVAVRFAAPVHASDGNTSDNGTDPLFGLAGGDGGGTPAVTSSGPAGGAVPASFNLGVPVVQAASAPPMAPQHPTIAAGMVPLAGIPIAIVARAEAGEKKFEIRLDPPDLGRIEVQLNVDSGGRATSHLIVDRADTLDLLRRDAPALERALQAAGLTTDEGALQFSLRDQSFAGRDQWAPATITAPVAPADSDLAPIDTALRRYGPPMGLGGGIDIRV